MNIGAIFKTHTEFGGIFAAAGSAVLIWLPFLIRKSLKIQRWPTAPGVITKSAVRRSTGDSVAYFPDVSFSFSVEGREYAGKTIAFMEAGFKSQQKAETRVACYPVGRNVTVFYNPQKPADSVLEKKIDLSLYVTMGLTAAAFLAIGICMLTGAVPWNLFSQP